MRKILIVLLFLPVLVYGVESADSLEINLQNLSQAEKTEQLLQASEDLLDSEFDFDAVRALGYSQRALSIARRMQDIDQQIKALIIIGECYRLLGDFDKAMSYFLESYHLNEKIDNPSGIASTIKYIGKIYFYVENYSMALTFYRKALGYLDESETEQRADIFQEIAQTYLNRGETNHAIAYYGIAEQLYRSVGDQYGVYHALNYIGKAYLDMGEYYKAVIFYKDLLKKFENLNRRMDISDTYTDLAFAYYKLGDFNNSLKYNEKALDIRKHSGRRELYGSALRNIAVLYFNWGKLNLSREYLDRALEALRPIHTQVARSYVRHCYFMYYEIYQKQKNPKLALDYYIKFNNLDDSLAVTLANEQIAKLNTAYEIENSTRESELVQKNMEINNMQLQRRNLALFLVATSLFIVLLTSFFIYLQYRRKLAASQELQKAVEDRTRELRDEIKMVERMGNSLRHSENTLRSIFDSVHDAIMILNRNGKVLSVNKQALSLFQTTEQSALASYFQFDFSDKRNPLSQLPEIWERVLQGNTIIREWISCDPSGKNIFDSEVVFSRIEYQGKEAIIASIRDITMRKKSEKNQLELERKSSALAMAVTANHELNQPLMILRGSLEMLEMTTPTEQLNEKQIQYFGNINKSIQRIQKILEQFKHLETVEYDEYADNEYMVKFDDTTSGNQS